MNDHEAEWVHATEIRERETADGLWRAYRSVAPTVESVRGDNTHGAAYISIRALEVLRDRASEESDWEALVECATDLLEARPSMAALENRINRTMSKASETASAGVLERSAKEGIDRAVEADDRAATQAAERIEGTVLTLSRSGTVETAILRAQPERVVVLESRPDREGVSVAAELAERLDVTVTLDASVAHCLAEIDTVLVGADTILADGSVVNKVGTKTAAVAAAREGVVVYVVAAADKISASDEPILGSIEREVVTENEEIRVTCPLFDHTPSELVTGVITERGIMDTAAINEQASEHERRARWKEPNGSAK